jgi:hypothetical protein
MPRQPGRPVTYAEAMTLSRRPIAHCSASSVAASATTPASNSNCSAPRSPPYCAATTAERAEPHHAGVLQYRCTQAILW